jgi:hypothetical protein
MRLRKLARIAAGVLVLSGAILTATASAAPRIYVRIGPPAPIVETRVVAPGPGYFWVPGYYTWDGGAYVWAAGRWQLPPRPRARWVAAHWVREHRGWYFVEGRWR